MSDNKNIKVYSKHNCSQCKEVKSYLNYNNIPYEEFNIEEDASAYDYVINSGYRMMPVVEFTDGTTVSGFDRLTLMQKTR